MKIRALAPEDKAAWMEMWLGYQQYYEVDLSATTPDTWDRLMAPPADGPFCLVAEITNEKMDDGKIDDGKLCGFTTFVYHGHTWQADPRCYLIDLFTHKHLRGKGIARALIKGVYEKADAHKCCQVYWLTQDFNEAGRRLYDKVATKTPFIKYQR